MPKPEPLPDIRAKTAHDCGTTAWRVVFAYHHGRNGRVIDLSNPVQGTDPSTLEAIIRRDANWSVHSGETFLNDLQHFAATLRPPICLMTLPGDSDSHYVVCAGVYRGRVFFHCPSDGTQSLPAGEFEAAWHGVGKYSQFNRWSLAAWPK